MDNMYSSYVKVTENKLEQKVISSMVTTSKHERACKL